MAKKTKAAPVMSPATENFYPLPQVDHPFVIIDATGKMWRIDPRCGTFRELIAG